MKIEPGALIEVLLSIEGMRQEKVAGGKVAARFVYELPEPQKWLSDAADLFAKQLGPKVTKGIQMAVVDRHYEVRCGENLVLKVRWEVEKASLQILLEEGPYSITTRPWKKYE